MTRDIQSAFTSLTEYCEKESFKGYDPYDGLNSTFFQSIPYLSGNRVARLIWIQFFKRSPVNFRPIAGIKKELNPKALGLFLSGYCNLFRKEPDVKYSDKINFLSDKLLELQNREWSGACWGYNFDWQARAFFMPKNSPTIVATTFIGSALLDAYEITGNEKLLKTARSACDFILKDINRTYDEKGNFAFSYSPVDKTVVYNASLLGSRLLARIYSITNEYELYEASEKSVRFCCNNQKEDGSWGYGKLHYHQWIDNFHTGYNLECIADFNKYTGNIFFKENLERGFGYYIRTFFTQSGLSKYYNNSLYPVDIHAPAQLIITLIKLDKFREYQPLAEKVLRWTINKMQSDKGYFYYQINKYFSSRIPYIRWAQAWMFISLSAYLAQIKKQNGKN